MTPAIKRITNRAKAYWELSKSLQTGLLLLTGLAGFSSALCPVLNPIAVTSLAGSLFLAISGSTVLNMWHDADIDVKMERTCRRPLPTMRVSPNEAFILGLALTFTGIAWAFSLSALYGALVSAGAFFDVVIYTILLKRRTAWSILWGGLAGGMPVLAGRALATGRVDLIGLLLALSVVMWIPTHIVTFNLRHEQDYQLAAIPTVPARYGHATARIIIACSSAGTAFAIAGASIAIGMSWGYLGLLGLLGCGLLALALASVIRPSGRLNFSLFKYASAYMLLSMVLVILVAF